MTVFDIGSFQAGESTRFSDDLTLFGGGIGANDVIVFDVTPSGTILELSASLASLNNNFQAFSFVLQPVTNFLTSPLNGKRLPAEGGTPLLSGELSSQQNSSLIDSVSLSEGLYSILIGWDEFFTNNFQPTDTDYEFTLTFSNGKGDQSGQVPTDPNNPTPPSRQVFRFFNTIAGGHFYTASEEERDFVQANLPQFNFEGASFKTARAEDADAIPVFRFFNTIAGGHFYTASEEERDFVQANLSQFNFEGVGFYAYDQPLEETVPMFRFFNTVAGGHFYTPSSEERDLVRAELPQFNDEGIGFYANPLSEGI